MFLIEILRKETSKNEVKGPYLDWRVFENSVKDLTFGENGVACCWLI